MFKTAASGLDGMLDQGSHIHGELRFDKEFIIQGGVTGSIVSDGVLKVYKGGEIDGEIRVRKAVVSGTVKGELHASEAIHITSTGKVLADLFTPSLTVDEGAFFEGRCSMGNNAGQPVKKDVESQKVTKMPLAQRG